VNFISGYGLVNGSIGLDTEDGRWTFEIWGKNLANKLYADDRGVPILGGALGQTFVSYGAPRTFGVRATAHF
jgi:iron complex outermembrane recepter protein